MKKLFGGCFFVLMVIEILVALVVSAYVLAGGV